MKTVLTAAAAFVGLAILASGPAMAGHKGKGHKHFKGGITITLGKGHGWYRPYGAHWYEPDCFTKTVWVFSLNHGHKIKKKVLVCH